MDPSYAGSDDEADAMAQFMGFSSFGSQGPAKKRKFNASTDAVIDGEELKKLDRGGKKGQGSGGNDMPLGKVRVLGQSNPVPKSNEDEIDLGDDEEDEDDDFNHEEGGPDLVDPDKHDAEDKNEEDGPQYIDTSLPPPEEETRAAQARIDAILAQAADTAQPSQDPLPSKKKSQTTLPGRGMAQFMSALQGPPPGPPPSLPEVQQQLQQEQQHNLNSSHQQRGKGERNPLWYVEYYDPSFNENPWARLEKNLGLQPVGTWLERPERAR